MTKQKNAIRLYFVSGKDICRLKRDTGTMKGDDENYGDDAERAEVLD